MANTYEAPSCQRINDSCPSRPGAATPDPSLRSASHSIFASSCGAGSEALHQTRIEVHTRPRCGDRMGRRWPSRPRSSSVPSCRPPHDGDLMGPLSPGSGEGQSRRRTACGGRVSERPIKRSELPDLRAHVRCLIALGAHGDRAVSSSSIHGALVRRRARSLTRRSYIAVAAKRCTSKAFSRASMK